MPTEKLWMRRTGDLTVAQSLWRLRHNTAPEGIFAVTSGDARVLSPKHPAQCAKSSSAKPPPENGAPVLGAPVESGRNARQDLSDRHAAVTESRRRDPPFRKPAAASHGSPAIDPQS